MIKKVEDVVTSILKDEPKSRDNDDILCVCVWYHQVGHQIEWLSAKDFLKKMASGNLYKAESIMRCRRKLQELHSNLRGKEYEKRRKNSKKVINELQTMSAEATGPSYSSGKITDEQDELF